MSVNEPDPPHTGDKAAAAKTGARRIAVILAIALGIVVVVAAVIYGLVFVILAPMM